jgi:hypothetical protein
MSYPQPDADKYALLGGDFFRLSTGLTSPGDMYESQQSAHAFAIGPDSDVSSVNIGYYDEQYPTFLNQLQIGTTRSWVGRIDARNGDKYAPSGRPGRILIWPDDIFDPSYIPIDFDANLDTLTFITPILEVIQYFQPQGSLEVKRNDKTYRIQEINFPPRTANIVIPYWGRKYASIRFTNLTAGEAIWGVIGVNYYINDQFKALETPLGGGAIVASGAQELVILGPPQGAFDALNIFVTASTDTGPTPIQVVVSDSPP